MVTNSDFQKNDLNFSLCVLCALCGKLKKREIYVEE